MVQPLTQGNSRAKDGQPRKRGQRTPQGRANTVASRLEHGIRSRSPVLLHVESEAQWQAHLEGFRLTYSPVGEVEECLVHLIAYQFWRWIARLLPYERDLTLARLSTAPEQLIADGPTNADIATVLNTPLEELNKEEQAARELLSRYQSLENGDGDGVVFSAGEVEEFFDWFYGHLTEEDEENETDDEAVQDGDGNHSADPAECAKVFDAEDRTWTAAEIQQQLSILSKTVGCDWRARLHWALYDYRRELDQRFSHLAEAKEHVAANRILALDALERVCLYERQISASFRHLVSQLERHQARRRGEVVSAPVAVDLSISRHGAE